MLPGVKVRRVAGWLSLGASTALSCFWAFWGIIENFHEGWYYDFWLSNVGLMIAQYLSPLLLFVAITVVTVLWHRVGALLHLALAGLVAWFFHASTNTAVILLVAPLVGLGLLYWVGVVPGRRTALALAVGLPLSTLALFGVSPAVRVSRRIDDGYRGARRVAGNGVSLVWAARGPGWPSEGADWLEARTNCRYLSEDGLTLESVPRNAWRLPTVDEVVRSMTYHGRNSGGVWDAAAGLAMYETKPDKESPLWDTHSQVIYWWTETEVDDGRSYIVAYDGQVWHRSKDFGPDYLGFRCVRDP